MKMLHSNDANQIKLSISQGNTEEALKLLLSFTRQTTFYKEAILLNSRFHNILKKQISGIISEEKKLIENNQINYGILALLDDRVEGRKLRKAVRVSAKYLVMSGIFMALLAGISIFTFSFKRQPKSIQPNDLVKILEYKKEGVNRSFASLNKELEEINDTTDLGEKGTNPETHINRSEVIKEILIVSKKKYNELMDWEIQSVKARKYSLATRIQAEIRKIPMNHQLNNLEELFPANTNSRNVNLKRLSTALENQLLNSCTSYRPFYLAL